MVGACICPPGPPVPGRPVGHPGHGIRWSAGPGRHKGPGLPVAPGRVRTSVLGDDGGLRRTDPSVRGVAAHGGCPGPCRRSSVSGLGSTVGGAGSRRQRAGRQRAEAARRSRDRWAASARCGPDRGREAHGRAFSTAVLPEVRPLDRPSPPVSHSRRPPRELAGRPPKRRRRGGHAGRRARPRARRPDRARCDAAGSPR